MNLGPNECSSPLTPTEWQKHLPVLLYTERRAPHFLQLAITPPFHLRYPTNGFFHQSTGWRAITHVNKRINTRVKSRKMKERLFFGID
jgi:hypothetical protein